MVRTTYARVRYQIVLFSGLFLFLLNAWAFFWSYDELSAPPEISLYRWVVSVAVGWLLVLRLLDIHKEGRLPNG